MSTRTVVRDRIVAEFQVLKENESGRVQEFDVSVRWLAPDETKRAATYCVVVTDESLSPDTQQSDEYELTGVLVLYAHDTKDARAKLDLMIEDALDVLRRSFRRLNGTIRGASIESITTTEASKAEDDWPQAVMRWKATHEREGML